MDPSDNTTRAGQLGSTARSTSQDISHQAADLKERAKSTVNDAAEQTRRKASEYAHTAKVRGEEMLDQQKHRAAEQLHTVGQAVHRAADKFREDQDDNIAGYVDAVADEVDRFARYLDKHEVKNFARDAQSFARREPEWFLGGMFLAGLALTRFLKSSGRGEEPELASRGQRRFGRDAGDEPWAPERAVSTSNPTLPPQTSTGGGAGPSPEVHNYGR